MTISLALYQPDIPQNAGTLMRLGACLDLRVHLIHPTGFLFTQKSFRRAGMDYRDMAPVTEHESFEAFSQAMAGKRVLALTTKATTNYVDVAFQDEDILLFGPETRGLPDSLLDELPADGKLRIPMLPDSRSLNLSNTVAIVAYEALRQHNFNDLR